MCGWYNECVSLNVWLVQWMCKFKCVVGAMNV